MDDSEAENLQNNSDYNGYNPKSDVLTDRKIARRQALTELENKDAKEDQQRKMAWVAMISMLGFTALLFSPIISAERVAALSDLLSMFYIAQAGVVATFFGSTAYMSK